MIDNYNSVSMATHRTQHVHQISRDPPEWLCPRASRLKEHVGRPHSFSLQEPTYLLTFASVWEVEAISQSTISPEDAMMCNIMHELKSYIS